MTRCQCACVIVLLTSIVGGCLSGCRGRGANDSNPIRSTRTLSSDAAVRTRVARDTGTDAAQDDSFPEQPDTCWLPPTAPPVPDAEVRSICEQAGATLMMPVVVSRPLGAYVAVAIAAPDGTRVKLAILSSRREWSQHGNVLHGCVAFGPVTRLPGIPSDQFATAELSVRTLPLQEQPGPVASAIRRRQPAGWAAWNGGWSAGSCFPSCYVAGDRCFQRAFELVGSRGEFSLRTIE